MKYNEFKEKMIPEYMKNIRDEVQRLTEEIKKENLTKRKRKSIENNILEYSAYFASLMLESHDVNIMTQYPCDPENNPIYSIIEKKTPFKWIIREKDTDNIYTIRRGKNGMFKLNNEYIYCCYPINNV